MRLLISCLVLAALSCPVLADRDYKKFETELDVQGLESLLLDVHVGEVDISASDDQQIHVTVKVYPRKKWFWRGGDLDDAELEIGRNGDRLRLAINDEDFEEKWLLSLPPGLALSVDMGIGDIEVGGLAGDISVDLGIGDARINGAAEHYGMASAEAGVGDASIHAEQGEHHSERAVVSQESRWQGDGPRRIELSVGVGSAVVRLD